MIESRLDPLLDGVGGGVEDRDLTIAQIAGEFRYLAEEARWRSVTAVLRILGEQSKGRDAYAGGPAGGLAIMAVTSPLLVSVFFVSRTQQRVEAISAVVIWFAVVLTFGIQIVRSREQRQRSLAQLQELNRLALLTLGEIAADAKEPARALDKEQRRVFRSLRSTDREVWDRVAVYLAGGVS